MFNTKIKAELEKANEEVARLTSRLAEANNDVRRLNILLANANEDNASLQKVTARLLEEAKEAKDKIEIIELKLEQAIWNKENSDRNYNSLREQYESLEEMLDMLPVVKDEVTIYSVKRIDETPHYSSEWLVTVKVGDTTETLKIIRRDGQDRAELMKEVFNCESISDIEKLDRRKSINFD